MPVLLLHFLHFLSLSLLIRRTGVSLIRLGRACPRRARIEVTTWELSSATCVFQWVGSGRQALKMFSVMFVRLKISR